MSDKSPLLFTPGPTPIPPQVQTELSKPMIHHRSPEFEEIFASLRNNLHLISQTDGESVVLTGSGTAAMESVVSSMFEMGDHVVVVDAGKFGKRWAEICKRYELNVSVIQKPWGHAVTVDDIMAEIIPSTRAVLVQACESSTGVYHPIEAIGKALNRYSKVLFVVDAITAFGIYPLSQRSHYIDVLIGASQKALMCPPGLSLVCLSKKAIEQIHPTAGMYLSLENELKSQVDNRPAFTPAISLVRGMERATEMILNEGRQYVYERHLKLQAITRGCFKALGFQLLANDKDASAGITAVHAISGLDVEKWLKQLRNDHGLWLASGQEQYKGKIFRMAHMGHCHERDLKAALNLIVKSLSQSLKTDQATEFLENS
jgi:aspartate aminotransferase-like enzyme